MVDLARRYPLRLLGFVQAVLAALAPFLPEAALVASQGILAALAAMFVHQAVTPVATALDNAARAAETAAVTVARDLTEDIAGPAGTVTPAAEQVVDKAVNLAVAAVPG